MQFDRAMALLLEGENIQRAAWVREDRNKYLTKITAPEGQTLIVAQGVEYVCARPVPFTTTAVLLGTDMSADDWQTATRPTGGSDHGE